MRHDGTRLLLEHDALGPVCDLDLSPKPGWYDRTTADGKPMTRVGSLQGTYLGVYPAKVCEYWLEAPKQQCRFCSVGLNLGADDADEKSVEEVLEVVLAARRESGITYVDFNTGHYEGHTFLDILDTRRNTDAVALGQQDQVPRGQRDECRQARPLRPQGLLGDLDDDFFAIV